METITKQFTYNKVFEPLLTNKDSRVILYGSRSSSKSDFVASLIFYRMLTDKYFKGIAMRNVNENNRESTYKAITDVIARYGMEGYFHCTHSPAEIICKHNGNKMLFRGMDDVTKIKSIKNPSFIWWEEEIPRTYEEYLTVSLTLRSPDAEYLQEYFTINPFFKDCPNYEDHWFWQKFFKNQTELSFRVEEKVEYDGNTYSSFATILHSTWRQNYWCPMADRIKYESLKNGDQFTYMRDSLGLWSRAETVGQFYKDFKVGKNTVNRREYNPELPLWLSFDFNNNPFSACTIYQSDEDNNKCIYMIDEICLKSPRNKLIEVLNEIKKRYEGHISGMYITGDPNGYKEDTTKEKGDNAYSMIFGALKEFKPTDKTMRSAPSVRASQNWLNDVFDHNEGGIEIYISMECRNSINEFTMLREDPIKGGTLKEKWTDPETGIVSEKYGHISDAFRYCMTQMFKSEFDKHRNGGVTTNVSYGHRPSRGTKGLY